MTFYNGMIRASFDWFKKSTKDLLFQPTVEAIRGNNAAFRNLGNITNQGVEMQRHLIKIGMKSTSLFPQMLHILKMRL